MFQKGNDYRLLQAFFDDPLKEGGFRLRELSRLTGVPPPSALRYLRALAKARLVVRRRLHGAPVYAANRDEERFRFYKTLDMLARIRKSGLLAHLVGRCQPDAIVLFGSAARGEDAKGSDIDLFILSQEEALELKPFERMLRRKISGFFSQNFMKLPAELKNNILNGIRLHGYVVAYESRPHQYQPGPDAGARPAGHGAGHSRDAARHRPC